jgi:hypothetical protein
MKQGPRGGRQDSRLGPPVALGPAPLFLLFFAAKYQSYVPSFGHIARPDLRSPVI